ncbi:MAG: UDP-N-acetylmuramoyl-L-alanine--D-glutamate ligase [Coriobacteriales bacterium]|jgi:UDP-N-acetylmuramoylalanine--D-glutamate ligase
MTQKVLILGVGKSGLAAARWALEEGRDVVIYAGKRNEKTEVAAAPFEQAGVEVHFDTEDVEGHFDLCVVSPGIPQTGAFYQSALAASDELISEPELAWRISPKDWIAITGTNGKTTTTSLATHLLNACGTPAFACGNIGESALDAARHRRPGEVLVVEMSSFQLASTAKFSPSVAVLLNITPDHVAWHGSLDAYRAAKLKIFENLEKGQCAIISEEVSGCADIVEGLRARGVRAVTLGEKRAADCGYLDGDGMLCLVDGAGNATRLCSADALKIKGAHNVENALAAACAVIDFGADAAAVAEALTTFSPLEHRIEPVATVGGVGFFNDSKATNVDATLKALTAFLGTPIVLLLGGHDKGTDLSELVKACEPACAQVICYGEAGERFAAAFEGASVPCERVGGMRDAFERACQIAQPGQDVVLSPACSSFDEFNSFEERGEVFKGYVADYARQGR